MSPKLVLCFRDLQGRGSTASDSLTTAGQKSTVEPTVPNCGTSQVSEAKFSP